MEEETQQPIETISAPIVPTLPEIQSSVDPLASLKTPSPIIQPTISFPPPPPIPSGVPVNMEVNQQLQGSYQTGPNPGAKPENLKGGTTEYIKAIKNFMQDDSAVNDKFKYGRAYSYGSGHADANFKRYYEHPKFKQLGFSPFRDNDTFYNERSSWWDDFSRMTSQWDNLVWSGFKSVWGSEQTAHNEMEEGMAIGMSSKDGFGAAVTNFGLNSAYTVGIMGEMILEDLALAAITAATFGAASPGTVSVGAARNAMGIGKLAKAWSGTYKFLNNMSKAGDAKNFFTAAKAWNSTQDVLKWMNPLQRTFDFTGDMLKGAKSLENLSTGAKAAKGFGQFYRDMREINLALSESFLEGEGASANYQQQLIDEFYNANGRMPTLEESQEIYDKGQGIKTSVSMANAFTIYATNKLVFDNLFNGYNPAKKLADSFLEGSGRFLKNVDPKLYKVGAAGLEAGVKTKGKKVADFLLKSAYVPWSKKYMLGNLAEGLQESSQEIIQAAALDYHMKKDSDPSNVGFYSALASIGKGTGEQFTGQGLETFLSGYLMGSLIQGGTGVYTNTRDYLTGSTKEAKEKALKSDDDILNAGNHVIENSLVFGDQNVSLAAAVRMANAQKEKSNEEGDEKTTRDMSSQIDIMSMHKVVSSGNSGLIVGHVDSMLTLDDKDLAAAYNKTEEEAADIREKLQTLKDRTISYQKKYDYQKKTRPNPYDPWQFSKKNKDGTYKYGEAYAKEMNNYLAYEEIMADMLFATESYEDVSKRMVSIARDISGQGNKFQNLINVMSGGTPVSNAGSKELSMLLDSREMAVAKKTLDDKIEILSKGTAEEKAEAAKLSTQRTLMDEWISAVSAYQLEMKKERKANTDPEFADKLKQTARVRPGAVVQDENGLEYTVQEIIGDKAVIKDKRNKIRTIQRSRLNTIKDAKSDKPLDFERVEEDPLSESISYLYDTYKKYLQHIASMKNGYVFDDQLNDAFRSIKDFYTLDSDLRGLVGTINQFSNPEFMEKYTQMNAEIMALRKKEQLANLQKAEKDFEDMAINNKFLTEISDLGVFVLPEDVDKLKDFSIVDFYDSINKDIVPLNSDKYKEILKIVEKYATLAGKTATGKKTGEKGTTPEAKEQSKFKAKGRDKNDDDKRTYADYAKQFGFDPNAETTQVDTEKVLREIIDSKYTNAVEKALARRLLTLIKPGSKVTFAKNLATPGLWNSTRGTQVDARYSSEDYEGGSKGHVFEEVILHELLHELTVSSLNEDKVFAAKIEELLTLAKQYAQTKEGKAKHGDKPLYGTMNAAEFIAEISNPVFQALLADIPYKTDGKVSNLWDEFMKALKTMWKDLMKVDADNTVLMEALSVITTKLDNIKTEAAPSPTATTPGAVSTPVASATVLLPTDTVTPDTPINLLKSTKEGQALVDELYEAYLKYLEKNGNPTPTENKDTVLQSEEFDTFKKENRTAYAIISKFNKDREKTTATGPAPIKTTKAITNIWGKDNTKTFSGKVSMMGVNEPVDIENARVIVDEYRGKETDDDTGEVSEIVILKDLDTGALYLIDLLSKDAKNYKYDELVLTSTPTAISPDTTLEEDLLNITEHNGLEVIENPSLTNKVGEPGAAKYNRKTNVIYINSKTLRKKYDEKAWTKPYKLSDGSVVEALPEDMFSSFEEFVTFVLEHEFQHSVTSFDDYKISIQGKDKSRKVSVAEYENYINNKAIQALGLLTEEDNYSESLMEAYNNISNEKELIEWDARATDVLSNTVDAAALSKELGVEFNSDYVDNLITKKKEDLAMSLTFEDLTVGKVVIMKDNSKKVVKKVTNKSVTLVPISDYEKGITGKTYIIDKGAIAKNIKMIHSEFMEYAEKTVKPTPEEIETSNKVVDVAKEEIDDPQKVAKEVEDALSKTEDELDNEFDDLVNKC